jgi:hypothetical protein
MTEEDLTLETLLSVRSTLCPELDEDLLRQCYLIQKRFQFSADRSISANAMERLIDDQVKALAGDAKDQPQ